MGVEHRFQIIDRGETAHWVRRSEVIKDDRGLQNFRSDPKSQWTHAIIDAYSIRDIDHTPVQDQNLIPRLPGQVLASQSPSVLVVSTGGPPKGGPDPRPAKKPAAPPKRKACDSLKYDDDLRKDRRYCGLDDVLDPDRVCTEMADATPAEQEANRAVLTEMEYARYHADAESEIAAVL
jgi:hypothetical protein